MLNKNISSFLRKSKIFNKGRYSRTRQIVRGAFFFSLLLNVVIVFGALFLFYLYTISWSYIWWPLFFLFTSFIIPVCFRQQPKYQKLFFCPPNKKNLSLIKQSIYFFLYYAKQQTKLIKSVQKMLNMFQLGLTNTKRYTKSGLSMLISYFSFLSVNLHNYLALFGFFTFAIIFNQILSGIMLSFSFIPEPMYVSLVRDEEDAEDLYTDHFFWLHERGVDLLFVFVFAHLLRKLYLIVNNYEQEFAWKSGTITFLVLQIVVFFGLVLCGTHLSEITLTIAANALYTFFMFIGKPYWWFFTDLCLNADTLVRMAYAHYTSAFFVTLLAIIHGYDMHYDWKQENTADGVQAETTWWDEVAANELGILFQMLILTYLIGAYLYSEPEPLAYEIFMWGDIGVSTDIRFYGVAPHWYFRPYMAWLIVCPSHRTGLFGLVYFFCILYFQPNIHAFYYKKQGQQKKNKYWNTFRINKNNFVFNLGKYFKSTFAFVYQPNQMQIEFSHLYTFFVFFGAILYVCTFLPFGRFYNRLGGNVTMLYAYLYIFIYLSIPELKKVLVPLYIFGLKQKALQKK